MRIGQSNTRRSNNRLRPGGNTGAVHSLQAATQDPAQAQLITHDSHAGHSSPRRPDVRALGDSPGSGAAAAAAGAVPAALHGAAAAPAGSDAHSRTDLDTDPDPRPDSDSDPDARVHANIHADRIIVCSRCCGAYCLVWSSGSNPATALAGWKTSGAWCGKGTRPLMQSQTCVAAHRLAAATLRIPQQTR